MISDENNYSTEYYDIADNNNIKTKNKSNTVLYVLLAVFLSVAVAAAAGYFFVSGTFNSGINDSSSDTMYLDDSQSFVSPEDEITNYVSSYASFEEYSSWDGSELHIGEAPLIRNDNVELNETSYNLACRIYDMALMRDDKNFMFKQSSMQDVTNAFDALDLLTCKASYTTTCMDENDITTPCTITWSIDPQDWERFDDRMMENWLTKQKVEAAGVTEDMTPEEAVKAINQYLCNTVEYDDSLEKHYAIDAYNGSAVCSGYAQAFQLMCLYCGIPAKYMHGVTLPDNIQHAWNATQTNGRWTYTDVCSNDGCLPGHKDRYLLNTYLWINYKLKDGLEDIVGMQTAEIEGTEYKPVDYDKIIYQSVPIDELNDTDTN